MLIAHLCEYLIIDSCIRTRCPSIPSGSGFSSALLVGFLCSSKAPPVSPVANGANAQKSLRSSPVPLSPPLHPTLRLIAIPFPRRDQVPVRMKHRLPGGYA